VGIDSLAGPSEVAIIADAGADPAYIAVDCMAQTEHDPLARAYVFTDSAKIAGAVRSAIETKYKPQVRITRCSLERAAAMVNAIAPEHLEILAADPDTIVRRIRHAGAIFAGYATPTALGDYLAGPSHVLPTGGTARFSSGLSVATFLKKTSYVKYSASAAASCAERAAVLADTEGLHYHAASLRIRS
jgi:histidinol dehydrogenase